MRVVVWIHATNSKLQQDGDPLVSSFRVSVFSWYSQTNTRHPTRYMRSFYEQMGWEKAQKNHGLDAQCIGEPAKEQYRFFAHGRDTSWVCKTRGIHSMGRRRGLLRCAKKCRGPQQIDRATNGAVLWTILGWNKIVFLQRRTVFRREASVSFYWYIFNLTCNLSCSIQVSSVLDWIFTPFLRGSILPNDCIKLSQRQRPSSRTLKCCPWDTVWATMGECVCVSNLWSRARRFRA